MMRDSGGGGGGHSRPTPDDGGGGGGSCFVSGTKVLLPDGSRRSIEEISAGDSVMSYNESNGTNEVS